MAEGNGGNGKNGNGGGIGSDIITGIRALKDTPNVAVLVFALVIVGGFGLMSWDQSNSRHEIEVGQDRMHQELHLKLIETLRECKALRSEPTT